MFTAGGIIFTVVLIPTLINKQAQMPRKSTVLTATILSIFSFTYFTLSFQLATYSTLSTATIWWLLAIFRGIKK